MNSPKISFQVLLTLLLMSMTLVLLPSDTLLAQLKVESQQTTKKNSSSDKSTNTGKNNHSIITSILKWLPQKRSGGSTNRPIFTRSFSISKRNETGGVTIYNQDSVCILSPIFDPKAAHLLWTRQPFFVWAGYSSALQVVDARSKKIVWQKKASEGSGRIKIDISLEAGKTYILKSFSNYDPDRVQLETTFQTVTTADWTKINRDLLLIEQTSIAQKQTREEIGLQKAAYFAKNQLWGDVQTTILSIWQDEKEGKQINVRSSSLPNDDIQMLLTEIENAFPTCHLDKL
jgi:hypothetical protein